MAAKQLSELVLRLFNLDLVDVPNEFITTNEILIEETVEISEDPRRRRTTTSLPSSNDRGK